jgi:hypothetical protein
MCGSHTPTYGTHIQTKPGLVSMGLVSTRFGYQFRLGYDFDPVSVSTSLRQKRVWTLEILVARQAGCLDFLDLSLTEWGELIT